MKKFIKILSIIILSISLFWIIVNLIPVSKSIDENPWLKTDKTLISAHRGGSNLNPENTEKAFDYVIIDTDYTDIVEIDVRLTKDNVIAINHNSDINDMALDDNSESIKIEEHTYDELRQYNLGRNFIDKDNGTTPYANYSIVEAQQAGLSIMNLENFFNKYNKVRNVKLLLEIKEEGEKGYKIVDMVQSMFKQEKYSWWKERTMIISFEDNVINYTINKYPYQFVGALGYKIVAEVAFQKLNLNSLYKANYHSLQLPLNKKIGPITINFATKEMIKMAHKRNQTIAYWTINDQKDMKMLIEYGADIITTDSPDVLANLLNK